MGIKDNIPAGFQKDTDKRHKTKVIRNGIVFFKMETVLYIIYTNPDY